MNLTELHKPEDLTINQLYLFQPEYHRDELFRGYVTKIEPNRVELKYTKPGMTWESVEHINFKKDKIWLYNANIYHKFQKLLEQQKQERDDLLLNKEVIVEEISKKKWYERFLRRQK